MSSIGEHDREQTALSDDLTNNDRALMALEAVETMAAETASRGEEVATKIGDLLCNLRHLCDAEGLCFADVDRVAYRIYSIEIYEQRCADAGYAGDRIEIHVCENCGWGGLEEELGEITNLGQRVAPNEPVPSGECPDCGALCQPYIGREQAS